MDAPSLPTFGSGEAPTLPSLGGGDAPAIPTLGSAPNAQCQSAVSNFYQSAGTMPIATGNDFLAFLASQTQVMTETDECFVPAVTGAPAMVSSYTSYYMALASWQKHYMDRISTVLSICVGDDDLPLGSFSDNTFYTCDEIKFGTSVLVFDDDGQVVETRTGSTNQPDNTSESTVSTSADTTGSETNGSDSREGSDNGGGGGGLPRSTQIAIGAGVGAFVVLCVIVAAIWCFRRRRRQKAELADAANHQAPPVYSGTPELESKSPPVLVSHKPQEPYESGIYAHNSDGLTPEMGATGVAEIDSRIQHPAELSYHHQAQSTSPGTYELPLSAALVPEIDSSSRQNLTPTELPAPVHQHPPEPPSLSPVTAGTDQTQPRRPVPAPAPLPAQAAIIHSDLPEVVPQHPNAAELETLHGRQAELERQRQQILRLQAIEQEQSQVQQRISQLGHWRPGAS